jgi:hypothetical protein
MKPSTSALKPTVGKVLKQPSAKTAVANKTSGRKPVARVAKSSAQAELITLLERINRNLDETEALLAS